MATVVRFAGVPSFAPRAFLAVSASLVRLEIVSRSCWAMIANRPAVSVLASGMSQQTKTTPESRRAKMKPALRLSRSNLAINSVAPTRRASEMAASSWGRWFFLGCC